MPIKMQHFFTPCPTPIPSMDVYHLKIWLKALGGIKISNGGCCLKLANQLVW